MKKSKLTISVIHYGWIDPRSKKALFLKILKIT